MKLIFSMLVFFAAAICGQSERPEAQVNPLAGDRRAIAAGQALFNQDCAVCHGPTAQGDRGPSLVSGAFPHGGADGEIFLSIRSGIAGTQMSAFPRLSSDQIWQIIAFLRDLSGISTPGSAANEKVVGDAAAGKTIFDGKGGCLN